MIVHFLFHVVQIVFRIYFRIFRLHARIRVLIPAFLVYFRIV